MLHRLFWYPCLMLEINEDDVKLMDAFLYKDPGSQTITLADVFVKRLKASDFTVASDNRPMPKVDTSVMEVYMGVATLLSRYTVGKLPKAFKFIPQMKNWEEVLYITEPEKWSANALYQATRIFASNLGAKKGVRFYRLVLLPRVREDIKKNKRLHFALYQTLKKALYKPAVVFKGILFPLCEVAKDPIGHEINALEQHIKNLLSPSTPFSSTPFTT